MGARHHASLIQRVGTAFLPTLFLLLQSVTLSAQTLRPVIVEHKRKARSKFEVVNNTLYPLNVILEPKSFSVSPEGKPSFRPLDSSIHLKLSAMSFRVPPKQGYLVFYEATADQLPAWFVVYCTFAGLPHQQGLNIQVELPHTVYLLQKKPLEKSDIRILAAEFDEKTHALLVRAENTGPCFGRALATEVRSKGKKRSFNGFPVFPHSQRLLRLSWEAPEFPEKVLLRFRGFQVEEKLLARRE